MCRGLVECSSLPARHLSLPGSEVGPPHRRSRALISRRRLTRGLSLKGRENLKCCVENIDVLRIKMSAFESSKLKARKDNTCKRIAESRREADASWWFSCDKRGERGCVTDRRRTRRRASRALLHNLFRLEASMGCGQPYLCPPTAPASQIRAPWGTAQSGKEQTNIEEATAKIQTQDHEPPRRSDPEPSRVHNSASFSRRPRPVWGQAEPGTSTANHMAEVTAPRRLSVGGAWVS